MIGFVLFPDGYGHLSIGSVYTRNPTKSSIPSVVDKGSLMRLEYGFTKDPWVEKDRLSNKLLDAAMQEYYFSSIFNPG